VSVQATFTATLVDEWTARGVTDAVICPGSRSTPLALALAQRLRVHVRLDERSAAFFALGLAMATGKPTVICVTSGTAAAELHPAVVEAHQARVPLIVCTADRPPELHHVGASQTIDQIGLFTTSTRWACDPGVPEAGQEASWRPLAVRAVAEALGGPYPPGPGPVHLNLAFREPLVGQAESLPPRPGPTLLEPSPAAVTLNEPLAGRGLIVVGGGSGVDPEKVLSLGHALGWPVLADPRSGCRRIGTIAAADAIVRTDPERPETVVLLGDVWLSKPLNEYIAQAAAEGARVVAVDPWRRWADPTVVVTEFHHVDGNAWVDAALERATPMDDQWRRRWLEREAAAQGAIDAELGDTLNEPLAARLVSRHAGASGTTIVAAASMPMRDLEWYAPAQLTPPVVMANRGVNGIDGVVSTALGVATAGRPTVAYLGDLAFLHDVSGLVNLTDVPCTFVVVDNGGGGIFSFLPQAEALEGATFERLFGTPPTARVADVARGFGLEVRDVTTEDELEAALKATAGATKPSLIHVRVPGRDENVARHRAINQAVQRALA
jgi:2-succinyl-5-enolpyruvyl-6-hydroxy-3-cyclohexene-1-carboxylate synthase